MNEPPVVAIGVESEVQSLVRRVSTPVAALIVCERDSDLSKDRVNGLVDRLLSSGCRYFVCGGALAEELHDLIDAALEERAYEDVATTFHPDESPLDIAEFFVRCASIEMRGLVALVGDKPEYVSAIAHVLSDF